MSTTPKNATPHPVNDRTRRCTCGAPTDAYLCRACTQKLTDLIVELPALLNELETTALRQDRLGGSGAATYATRRHNIPPDGYADHLEDVLDDQTGEPTGARVWVREPIDTLPAHLRTTSGRVALPVTPWALGWDASNHLGDIRSDLRRWAREATQRARRHPQHPTSRGPVRRPPEVARRGLAHTGPTCAGDCRHESCALARRRLQVRSVDIQICAELLSLVPALRMLPDAGDILDALTWIKAEALNTIDRRQPDVFAGRCEAEDYRFTPRDVGGTVLLEMVKTTCGTELYGRDDDDDIQCRGCGEHYSMSGQRAKMREAIDGQEARPRVIADALTGLDLPITDNTINVWARRAKVRRDNGSPAHDGDFYAVGVDRCPAHEEMLDQSVLDKCPRCKPLYRVGDVRVRVEAAAGEARMRAAEKRVNAERRSKGRVA